MFTVNEMANAVNGRIIKGIEIMMFSNFSKDTRNIINGDFYIPLVGENFDGHDYILDAIEKGAKGSFISNLYNKKDELIKEIACLKKEITLIEVDDTLIALQELAKYNRDKRIDIKVIAITGSVGKTSTKEMIYSVLEKGFNVLKTEGNLNNHIGLPLTLLKLNEQDICVVEMGMNNFNEISILSKIAKPDVAVITNIGVAHIGNLGSQENIFKAKCEILDGLKENGILVVNSDDEFLKTLESTKHYEVIKYGLENNNVEIKQNSDNCDNNITAFFVNDIEYKLNCIGAHNVSNALCAMAIGKEFGMSNEQISEGYKNYKNENMRMQQIKLPNNIILINDAYNANYDSMKAGIEAAMSLNAKRHIVVLGDMFELGKFSIEIHQKIGELFEKNKADILVTCGNDSREISKIAKKYLGDNIYHFDNKNDTIIKLKELINEGDVVYFKASRGMKFEEIVNSLTNHYGG